MDGWSTMDDNGDPEGMRRTRWSGLVRVSIARLYRRTMATRSGRLLATICVVAMTIAVLVVVTGIALGLADGGVVDDDDADVRIGPEERTSLSSVDGVESPRLGAANERAERIGAADGVDHASPTLIEPVALEPADGGEPERVLLVGVVPDGESRTVAGLPTADLEPGDPHYADGSYDGPPRGEIVLSAAASDRLEASAGDDLGVANAGEATDEPVPTATVIAVEEAGDGDDDTPVALVHLSELQTVAGADDGQLADRMLVWGDGDAGAAAASEAYPDATVESIDRTDPSSLFDDDLAFATSLLAMLVGVAISASFVATTAGMAVEEDRRTLAVLESVGFPTYSRLVVVAVSTLLTTLCGALLGVVLGVGGIYAVNAAATATVAPGAVAQVHPIFVPYAVGVALVSGLVATPYPLVVAARTSVLEEVGR